MNAAFSLLPLLKQKPHLLVLNHAAATYLQLKSNLLTHANSQHFTFITVNPKMAGLNSANILSAVRHAYMSVLSYHGTDQILRCNMTVWPEQLSIGMSATPINCILH